MVPPVRKVQALPFKVWGMKNNEKQASAKEPQAVSAVEKPIGGAGTLLGVMLVLVALLGGGMYLATQTSALDFLAPSKSARRETPLADMTWGVAMVKCEEAVRSQLKNPDSAKFDESTQPQWDGQKWSYASRVTAENSFGASVQTPYVCEIRGETQSSATVSATLAQ